ncbi:MAG: hypothetical protein JWM07_79 [Candidatus Saccharibacteria bacterium]|nr:hypothetical protein [Candidatus Saccharibacteria bacterium]
MERIQLNRINVFNKDSNVSAELSSTIAIGSKLFERLNSCASVLKLNAPIPANPKSIYNYTMLIRIRKTFPYETAESEIAETLKQWYEEHCGGIDVYRPLYIVQQTGDTPSEILRPTPDSPRAQIGNLTILHELAKSLGNVDDSSKYGHRIHALRDQLGQRGHF